MDSYGWASVENGKWHRTESPQPTFVHSEKSLCGITFRPLNVEWDRRPTCRPEFLCKKCRRES